jgi:orotidine-5'-phosphate decarboxylase
MKSSDVGLMICNEETAMNFDAKEKLIVALDVDSPARALELFSALRTVAGMFKIGTQLFTAAGPDIVRKIVSSGGRVFLDLKFHDIPNTVAAAGVEATRLGVSIFNVHASGGAEMMKRVTAAVAKTAEMEKIPRPKVIAVTVLTSMDQNSLRQAGIDESPAAMVISLARSAQACGMDGVVASAHETSLIRAAIPQREFIIVTPGIRSASDTLDDQKRVLTAADAIKSGADYIVVGRPILNAGDPAAAARQLVAEMNAANC